jgi:hypothetical protein
VPCSDPGPVDFGQRFAEPGPGGAAPFDFGQRFAEPGPGGAAALDFGQRFAEPGAGGENLGRGVCVEGRVRLMVVLVVVGCSSPSAPQRDEVDRDAERAAAPGRPGRGEEPGEGAPPCPGRAEIGPGLVAERVQLPGRDACLTVVRIDLVHHRLRLLTAAADGGARPAPRWAADFGLVAVTNTSMFGDDLRSIGILRDARSVNRDRDNPKLGGFFAFDPVDPASPPVLMTGRDCPGFDLADLRRRYRGLIQNYRLLDCDGAALPWADKKVYSAAGVGLDRTGRVVFLHSREPVPMTELNRVIGGLDLAGAMYAEGGPEASLHAPPIAEIGSFETGFFDGSNTRFWDVPNVLGASSR